MGRAEEVLREALALEDPHARAAWDQEIDRRLDAVDSGAMWSIPAAEALRRLRDRGSRDG